MFRDDFEEAKSYHERGQLDLAIQKYIPLLAKKPHDPVLLYYVGTCYLSAGHNGLDRKSTRLNSSHIQKSRMPSSA